MTVSSQAQPLTLAGKVAIVTGGSRGIGAGIAIELAKRGANVAITYVSPSSEKLADDVISTIANLSTGSPSSTSSAGAARAIKIQADTCDLSSPAKIVAATTAAFGPTIDILVNNAGAEIVGTLRDTTPDVFAHAFDTNVRGLVFTTQAVLPHLPSGGGGRIISIGSVLGRVGIAAGSIYCATKAAMEGLTRGWAHELGPEGHTVNVVAPGYTMTDMIDRIVVEGVPREAVEAQKGLTPMEHRFATAEDIALVVAMLAEPSGRWVTGQTIQASGGLFMG
ncbi:Dehydrogenase OXI1 [Lasiodiplodia hormozganensis]|uniref:Dehydrogenase OXI1 n=1 Tax=Lasiodiplodia hormozganensis TaxID=869390 RepID=A0AA40D3K6_9PEZI|nr:Dehydrogenase OXI1 [Lasiodiplodia hormozganensis]